MASRLAFAVATCRRPDVLLVDEVFAVGDIAFQEKCMDRLEGFSREGTTILLVSHNPSALSRMCSRALWLNLGMVSALGPTHDVLHEYITFGQPELVA
jgi:ABC-type polysaccharide/polyol phosphate transport system ATPase subunit